MLDTNVLSELLRPAPEPVVRHWLAQQPPESVFISSVTEAELRFGAALLSHGKRRTTLTVNIDGMLEHEFGGQVLFFRQSSGHRVCRNRRGPAEAGPTDADPRRTNSCHNLVPGCIARDQGRNRLRALRTNGYQSMAGCTPTGT